MKQRLLGYFLLLWGAYLFVYIIQDPFEDNYLPSSGYWGIAYTGVNIIWSLIFFAMAVVLLLLGRKVLGNKTDTSA